MWRRWMILTSHSNVWDLKEATSTDSRFWEVGPVSQGAGAAAGFREYTSVVRLF